MFVDYEYRRQCGLRGAARSAELTRQRGYTPAGQKLWSAKELDTIRRLYPDYEEIARRLPGRTRKALELRAARLGITKHSRPWTTRENRILRQLWPTTPAAHLATMLDRRESTIHKYARRLGLPYKERALKVTGIRNYDELRASAQKLNLTMRDLSEMTRSGGYFRNPTRRAGKGVRRHIHDARAAKALGGKLVLDWPEG